MDDIVEIAQMRCGGICGKGQSRNGPVKCGSYKCQGTALLAVGSLWLPNFSLAGKKFNVRVQLAAKNLSLNYGLGVNKCSLTLSVPWSPYGVTL